MNLNASKLGLGTVQWGMNYGVSNTQGQTPPGEVDKILKTAHIAGISLLDTACLYGNAEQVLGQSDLSPFRIITKTPQFSKDLATKSDINNLFSFSSSLQKLGLKSAYGI